MTVTIYSIGDINYLELILNAIAALFKTEIVEAEGQTRAVFKVLGSLLKLGFLVGLILAIFRGLLRGRLGLTDFIVSFLVVWAMFVPKVNVVIEDMYTGSVKAVANVPLGPAFIGGALSQIGYRVTELFETAFSLPNMVPMTSSGFNDPLHVLIKTRRALMQHLGQANSPVAGADVRKSFVNYIKDCTLTGVALHRKTMNDIERDPDVMNGITFEHNAFGTQLFLGGQPTEPTCTEATSQLKNFVAGTWRTALNQKLAADLNISPEQVETTIQQALDALTDGAVQAQDFMLTAATILFLEEAMSAYHLDQMHFAAAQMVQQAILQRNTQWAAQYSMFDRYVRPILTFIEGFTYAISPLVAFALTLGPMAFRVAGLYLMLAFWIQLWMPILAVINLYIQMAASKQMAALVSTQYQYPSIAGLMQSDWILQDWLGVGGLLASSAPALAFMLLSGSAVAITHMVGRLEGGDAIDERILAPDTVTNAPVQRVATWHEHDPIRGTRVYGTERALPSFDLGTLYQSLESRSRQEAKEAVETFSQSVGRSIAQTFSTADSAQKAHDFVHSIAQSKSHTDSYIRDQVTEVMKKTGVGKDKRDAVTLAFLQTLAGGAGLGPFKVGGGEEWSAQYGVTQSQMDEIHRAISEHTADSDRLARELAERVAQDVREGTSHVVSTGWNAQDLGQISKQAQDVLRTSDSWNQTRQLGEQFGVSGSYDALTVSQQVASNPALMQELSSYLSNLGLKREAIELGRDLSRSYHLGSDQAYATAGLMLMTGYAKPNRAMPQAERTAATTLGYSLIGRAMRGPDVARGIPPADGDGPTFGATRERVDQAGLSAEGLEQAHARVRSEVEEQIEAAQNLPERTQAAIEAAGGKFQSWVEREKGQMPPSQLSEELARRLQASEENGSIAKKTYEIGAQTFENAERGFKTLPESFGKEFEGYKRTLKNLRGSVQEGVERIQESVKNILNNDKE